MVTTMQEPEQPKAPNNRFNFHPESLHDLQVSLYDWQKYNFGEQDNERVLMGICEEAGELCHAHLKLEQKIRGTTEQHEADMVDAVGDIMMYLLNYLSGMGEKFPSFVAREDVEKAEDLAVIRKAVLAVFRVAGKIVEDPKSKARVQHLVTALIYLCAIKGWDLEEITRKTWQHIGPRDWHQYPETGFAPETAAPEPVQQQSTAPEQIPSPQA